MVKLRKDTWVQRSLTERLVRSRQQLAGHVQRMADDRLPKRAVQLREQGRRGRGRSMLIWEDCVKRDVRKAWEEEDWKKKTRDRGGWKRLSDEAVKKLRAAPHPWGSVINYDVKYLATRGYSLNIQYPNLNCWPLKPPKCPMGCRGAAYF